MTSRAHAVSFTGLGDLPGGSFSSLAYDVSGDGSVVVGEGTNADGLTEAFRWTAADGMVGLGFLSHSGLQAGSSRANGVSVDGTAIVGSSRSFNVVEAFRWTQAGGLAGLGDLLGGEFQSEALAVSDDGSVVVGAGATASADAEAMVWTQPTGIDGIGFLPSIDFLSVANAVSGDGTIVTGASRGISSTVKVFRYTEAGGMVDLGGVPLGNSFRTSVNSMSANASTIVGGADTNQGREAFYWTSQTGYVVLGDMRGDGSPDSRAYDVTADGSVVVGQADGTFDGRYGPDKAFIWDATRGMRDLNVELPQVYGIDLTGWLLLEASGISADGNTIVGWGLNPAGDIEAWVAVIPEPSSMSMALLAALGLLFRRNRTVGQAAPNVTQLALVALNGKPYSVGTPSSMSAMAQD